MEQKVKKNVNYRSFVGNAYIYDEMIFIDTITGKGYDRVIAKMNGYIDWYSSKIRLYGFEREDIKQLIITILLDGIRRYNPSLHVKLSTFLYVHIKNRITSRIKEEDKKSENATQNVELYNFGCSCGNNIVARKNDNIKCNNCVNKDIKWSIRPVRSRPSSLEELIAKHDDDIWHGVEYTADIEAIEKKMDFNSIMKNEDPITRKIAQMMYFNDYSISDAAQVVGLSCWAASLRLKKIQQRQKVKEFI